MGHVPMGLWDGIDMRHTLICERDRWTSREMSHGIVGWDGQWDTRVSVKGTGGHPVECSMESWDGMDSGTHAHQ